MPRGQGDAVPESAPENPPPTHLSGFVRLFFNALLVLAISAGLLLKLDLAACVPPALDAFCIALILLILLHLTWRYMGRKLEKLRLSLGHARFVVEHLKAFFDELHPWGLSLRALWIAGAAVIAMALFLRSSRSPFHLPELPPEVQGFSIHSSGGDAQRFATGDQVEIPPGESVLVQAVIDRGSSRCRWSTENGNIQASAGCSAAYSAPLGAARDTLSVSVKSPCGTYSTSASLSIEVTHN